MSEHKNLPDNLAACEAKLAAMQLPASQIDRDQLMFRAGYAAGESKSSGGAGSSARPPAAASDAKRFGPLGVLSCSAASAAVAATLAVAITLQLRPSEQLAANPTPTEQTEPPIIQAANDNGEESNTENAAPPARLPFNSERWLDIPTRGVLTVGGPMLELRNGAFRQTVAIGTARDGSPRTSAASRGGVSTSPAKSHRELLNEFLPQRNEPDQETGGLPFWRLWNASPQGVAI